MILSYCNSLYTEESSFSHELLANTREIRCVCLRGAGYCIVLMELNSLRAKQVSKFCRVYEEVSHTEVWCYCRSISEVYIDEAP